MKTRIYFLATITGFLLCCPSVTAASEYQSKGRIELILNGIWDDVSISFTGNIKDLTPSPTLIWLKHAFAPAAAFINLTDQRYMNNQKDHLPGEKFVFNLLAINDLPTASAGRIEIKLLDSKGIVIFKDQMETTIDPYGKKAIPYTLTMPQKADGYLLLSEYTPAGSLEPVISRRYIKVGSDENYAYPFFDR